LPGFKKRAEALLMSSEIAIKVENLSKCYHIYEKPSDRLMQMLARSQKKYFKEFWALKDASLEIYKGETVGIIGRNGSGKSTLLQLICGTLNPTGGTINTQGRIAALLELGSGFSPEFTGRENVYMNAALLGLSKEDTDALYQEIAAFADIGDFINQPVKTYSSGMVVRLAFAVQACVQPEILIVDEALAVGDLGFQYKCFKRMEALRAQGVTILMVTHATASVLEYADRCIVLNAGRIVSDTKDILAAVLTYEKGMIPNNIKLPDSSSKVELSKQTDFTTERLRLLQSSTNTDINEKRFGTARAIIESFTVFSADGTSISERPILRSGEKVTFRFNLTSCENINDVVLGISISRASGGDIWGDNNLNASHPISLKLGHTCIEYSTKLPLSTGEYLIHCGLAKISEAKREELDQRRPIMRIKFWSTREQVGSLYAPISISEPA